MLASPEMIFEGVKRLQAGGVVALRTETVYGLAAVATNDEAVRALVEIRGRDEGKPLSVAVADDAMARDLIDDWPTIDGVSSRELARKFWPGPLTLVLPKNPALRLPRWVCAGGEGIGLRCPDHSLALALIQTVGEPLVLPSANRPGEAPATSASEVERAFGGSVYVIDGGASPMGVASTVVSFVGGEVRVLREGALGVGALGIGE